MNLGGTGWIWEELGRSGWNWVELGGTGWELGGNWVNLGGTWWIWEELGESGRELCGTELVELCGTWLNRDKRVLMEKVVSSRCVVGNFLFIFDADLTFHFLMY